MNLSAQSIPDVTIEAVARSIFKETFHYGFKQVDYLRFVNLLLDMSMKNESVDNEAAESPVIVQNGERLNLPLSGERVNIRAFNELDDVELLKRWVTDKDGRHFLLSRITAKQSNIDELIKSANNIIGMITLKDQTPIGLLAFLDHDEIQRKAELRKLIGESEFRGKGYAKEATELWIQYGISFLNLKKIYLNTLDTNIRNIRLNEELGFKVEGILRNECYFDSVYHDILKMGLLID
ncbi:MAG: GNAT family N-acetyltransferase [Candidatus Zhuqueibacterota bacterium]